MLRKPLHIVLMIIQNPVYHRRHHVQSAHQTMQNSHLSHSRELVEITRSVVVTIGTSVQSPCVWKSVLPKSETLGKYLMLLIQYPELLSYYRMVCCGEIQVCSTHFGSSYKYRGILQIMEFELHFCGLIVAHFCIYVENIQRIGQKLCEPLLQMTNLAWQRTN